MDFVFFLIKKIKYNKMGKEKKFISVKLYGAKPNIVITPKKNGAKYITKNLLLNNIFKFILFI
jgi:hypothetical protein